MPLYEDETPYSEPENSVPSMPTMVTPKPKAAKKPKAEEPPAAASYHVKLTFDTADTTGKTGVFQILTGEGQIESAAIETLKSTLVMVIEGKAKRFKLTAE